MMKRGQAAIILVVVLVAAVGAFVLFAGSETTGQVSRDVVGQCLIPCQDGCFLQEREPPSICFQRCKMGCGA